MKQIRMIEHKLAELTIKKYRLFQNFKLDLTDDKGNPLDTVILAGINGSGKTTILDFISETLSSEDKKDKSKIVGWSSKSLDLGVSDLVSSLYFFDSKI